MMNWIWLTVCLALIREASLERIDLNFSNSDDDEDPIYMICLLPRVQVTVIVRDLAEIRLVFLRYPNGSSSSMNLAISLLLLSLLVFIISSIGFSIASRVWIQIPISMMCANC